MSGRLRWVLGLVVLVFCVASPLLYYRYSYTFGKRFREVVPGQVYRSGQLSADGFDDVIRRYRIRTIVNLQNEYPDPALRRGFLNRDTIRESEICRQHGVRYLVLAPDLLPPPEVEKQRPKVIGDFLKVMDDPSNYPILFHCKAGLHRTGLLAAIFRMEYQGWSRGAALREMKAHGFGEFACSPSNDYVNQYILHYTPRKLQSIEGVQP